MPQDRTDDLVQRGEGDVRLRFDPAAAQDLHVRRSLSCILEEGGLADTRLAADDEHPASRLASVLEERAEPSALGVPAVEHPLAIVPAVAESPNRRNHRCECLGRRAILTPIPVPNGKDTEVTTPETTANRSLRSRERGNIPPGRRDHRATPVSTAGSGVDTHEMVLMHRVLRREVGQLSRLFRSAANDPARSKIIGAHAREMLDFLHTHHTGEDLLLFPLLRERRALDPELMDRMDAQHAQVNDAVVAINAELPTWTTSADAAAGERMAACIDTMMPSLIGHCDEEEQKLLPVVSVTLSQSEWDALGKHGISAIPVTRRLVTLGYITEETDDAERQKFMQVLPAPVRLAYKLIGRRQFTHETTAIRG